MERLPMPNDLLSTIQRLLVVQLDPSATEAIATLQRHHPEISVIVLEVQEDNDSRLIYRIQSQVPLTVYEPSHFQTIHWIRDQHLNAAIFLMPKGRSPYVWAYRCYLAGVPIRMGLSQEFGGQVLSHEIAPPDSGVDPHLYLLQASGWISADVAAQNQIEAFP
jgi:hypothetical protein